jgi:hypothetical protein
VANPYHVRLAISQYGDRFRAELFTEDLGDTDGELLPADWRDRFNEWMSFLEGGGSLPTDTSRAIGAQLFDWLLSGTNRAKWVEVLARMDRDPSRPIRILIDSSTATGPGAQDRDVDRIHNLPYGLLFDSQRHAFLFRPREGASPLQYVRIVRRTTPRLLNLGRPRWPLRLLVAAAEPKDLEFAGPEQVSRLLQGLAALPAIYAVSVCTPDGPHPLAELPGDGIGRVCRCTREHLRDALKGGQHDLLHLMAHGRGSGLLLCKSGGEPVPVEAEELAEWCRGKVQLAFLQICKAARTAGQGAFGGLAQRLLNPDGGDLAAVVASPYVLEATRSTEAALAFYEQLGQGDLPDRAVRRDLEMANFGWAFLELWVRPSALGDTGTRGAFQFVSPYRGLSTFQERDADVFFGRDAEVTELTQILSRERLVAVVGDSGSGKSSLLQAGLAHRVRTQGLDGRTGWRIVSVRPGTEPARSLMVALLGWEGQAPADLPTPERWLDGLTALLEASCSEDRPLLLLFDQVEEMFTLCRDEQQRQAVAQALARMAQRPGGNARMIVGMRSDYMGSAVTLPELGELIKRPWVLRPPGAEEVRAIVARPAEVYGYRFQGPIPGGDKVREQGLLERILSDPLLSGGGSAQGGAEQARTSAPLPLLEFALERLWLQAVDRGSQEFSHDDYDRMGGLSGAIARHADEMFQALPVRFQGRPGDSQRLAEFVFTSVVSTEGTRRPRARQELEEESGDNAAVTRDLIDHLVGERLLTIRNDPKDLSRGLVDIAHESLIKRWGKLQEWLNSDVQERQLRENFQRDSETYGKREKRLPALAAQRDYLNWIGRRKPTPTQAQREFVQAMRNYVRFRGLVQVCVIAGSLAIAAVMIALAVWARTESTRRWSVTEQLDEHRRRAEEQGELAVTDLAKTGWGVVFPQDIDPEVKIALDPLLSLRRKQATRQDQAYYREFIGEGAYRTGETAIAFLKRNGATSRRIFPDKVPYYLLIVGDPTAIPFEFQYDLDVRYAVGRICFDTVEEYGRYARTVAEAETLSNQLHRTITVFAPEYPADPATDLSTRFTREIAAKLQNEMPSWILKTVAKEEATKARLGRILGGVETPAILVTAGHGMTWPKGNPRQRSDKGALLCQDWSGFGRVKREDYFHADDISSDAQLKGMIAVFHSSHSAGTPQFDDFPQNWSEKEAQPQVAIADEGFVARLPQRLLSHPQGGALAVLGHVERCWAFEIQRDLERDRRENGPFASMLKRLMRGYPLGACKEFLDDQHKELIVDLHQQAQYSSQDNNALKFRHFDVTHARNWIIIGDPAVRLAVTTPKDP